MTPSPQILVATAAVLASAALPTTTLAAAPAPSGGSYAGAIAQAGAPKGAIRFKLGALSNRVIRVTGSARLTCADGSTVDDRWDIVVFGPKVAGGKRFSYTGDGIAFSGRLTSSTAAKGTLERSKDGCSATGLAWTVKRK
jgi:hypothetical protein